MKIMKNRIMMMTIKLGMTIILTVLTLVVALLAIVARSERLIIGLAVPLKSINGVARGNVKRGVHVCMCHLSYYMVVHQ